MPVGTVFFYAIEPSISERSLGFTREELANKALASSTVKNLLEQAEAARFRYAGDTGSTSKACTCIKKKRISIGPKTSADQALLSLTYELTNAKNEGLFKTINDSQLSDKSPNAKKALIYAYSILAIEALAQYNKTIVAIELGLTELLPNKTYIKIVQYSLDQDQATNAIFGQMVRNGTVHSGKKTAVNHYVESYFHAITAKPKQ